MGESERGRGGPSARAALGLDTATVTVANRRRSYEVRDVAPEFLGEQQKIADTFFAAGLLPKRVDTKELPVWRRPGS